MPRRLANIRPLLVLVCTALLIGACGVKFYYRQLDWIVPWYLEDYITLNHRQNVMLERQLNEILDWHCASQLPEYAAWLRRINEDTADGLTAEEVEAHYLQLDTFWTALMQALSPDVAEILASATDEQIEELYAVLKKEHEEKVRRHYDSTPEERTERSVNNMRKRLKPWIGELTDGQMDELREWSRTLEPIGERWLQLREAWQNEFLEATAGRDDEAAFAAKVHSLLVDPQSRWDEAYLKKIETNKQRTFAMLARLHAMLTPEQKEHMKLFAVGMSRDFDDLSCQ